jgi:hypothetical protein
MQPHLQCDQSPIRQNLIFTFLYIALVIPVATGVLYPWFGLLFRAMIAGAAMSLSSVSVIMNALRLSHKRLWKKQENQPSAIPFRRGRWQNGKNTPDLTHAN